MHTVSKLSCRKNERKKVKRNIQTKDPKLTSKLGLSAEVNDILRFWPL